MKTMMNLSLKSFLFFDPFAVYSQPIERDRLNVTDENGLKQGNGW